MADETTNTELQTAHGVFSLVSEETGERLITVVRWNTGDYGHILHEYFKGSKRQRDATIDAMVLLANSAQCVKIEALQKPD